MATVSLLATVGDLAASQAAGGISALLPSGIILPYGGATPPTGWLFCNGQSVNRTTYAGLFSAIGTAHGSGDGSTTFNVPDLRGRFVRGTDTMSQNAVTGAANRDLDRAARTAANSGGNTGDAVGSVQINATKVNGLSASSTTTATIGNQNADHYHYGAQLSGQVSPGTIASSGSGWACVNVGARDSSHTTSGMTANHGHGFSVGPTTSTTVSSTDNETRPLNANVNYIIKV